MPIQPLGTISHYPTITHRRLSIAPAHESIHEFATIASMKRGNGRKNRPLPDTLVVDGRVLEIRWIA